MLGVEVCIVVHEKNVVQMNTCMSAYPLARAPRAPRDRRSPHSPFLHVV